MSRTLKDKTKIFSKEVKHRQNIYGLCMCFVCKLGRRKGKNSQVMKVKRRWKTAWKTGKKLLKGVYTD